MQVLKDEIKDNIINAATEVFLEQGFHKASMQKIAKKASVSTSNIYNYFESKRHLFEYIIKPVADDLNWTIKSIMTEEEQIEGEPNDLIEVIVDFIEQRLKERHKEIVLLFDYSQDSNYSKYKDNLILMLEKHFIESLKDSAQKKEMKLTFHIIANNLVEGIIEIARHYENENQTCKAIKHFLKYHLSGITPFY